MILSDRILFTLIIITVFFNRSIAQGSVINLTNPSFEDVPRKGEDKLNVLGWFDCGKINFPGESAPDIHPNGFWENNLPASDKNTYLGMVVRDNSSYEAVSQVLQEPLMEGKCYKFSINLARAQVYKSQSRITKEPANYTTPVVLRLFGGSGYCNERELLAQSEPVTNASWQINSFEITPKSDIRYIVLMAYYKTPVLMPYNGNLLVDNASAFVQIPCPGELQIYADNNSNLPPHKRKKKINSTPKPDTNKSTLIITKPNHNYKPKILQELNKGSLKEGQTIEIKKLFFEADSSSIGYKSYPVLNDLVGFLSNHPEIIVEIGGHTNNVPTDEFCNKLSNARAKAVTEYLVEKGINPNKIQFKGYGKTKPVSDNRTAYGRQKNQRVEIKILSLNS